MCQTKPLTQQINLFTLKNYPRFSSVKVNCEIPHTFAWKWRCNRKTNVWKSSEKANFDVLETDHLINYICRENECKLIRGNSVF